MEFMSLFFSIRKMFSPVFIAFLFGFIFILIVSSLNLNIPKSNIDKMTFAIMLVTFVLFRVYQVQKWLNSK